MARVIQVELTTPAKEAGSLSCMVTWMEAALKPAVGMLVVCKGDKRQWTVAHAYNGTPVEMDGINSGWKVGGL